MIMTKGDTEKQAFLRDKIIKLTIDYIKPGLTPLKKL